jgi:HEAT repeat protein
VALLERDWQQRIVAIRAMGVWGGDRSVSALKICLQHPHEYVRAAAAQAIADIGIRADLGERLGEAIFTLLLASSDRHWVVRTAVLQAMRTLGRQNVGRQEFINAVILALDDEECMVRIAAVRALFGLKGKQALPRLALIAKHDFEYLVRDAAQDIVQDISVS